MSSARLMILGVLRGKGPLHGYDVRRELETWDAAQWANIAYGSIYFALGKMAEEGLVEVVSTDQTGPRPARTVYSITQKGIGEFESLLRGVWWKPKEVSDPFHVALTFMNYMPPDELLSALRFRADSLRATLGAMKRMDEQHPKGPVTPRHISEIFRLEVMQGEAALQWLEEVIGKVGRKELP